MRQVDSTGPEMEDKDLKISILLNLEMKYTTPHIQDLQGECKSKRKSYKISKTKCVGLISKNKCIDSLTCKLFIH